MGNHVEHIYQKLGVETRTAAAAVAFGAADLANPRVADRESSPLETPLC